MKTELTIHNPHKPLSSSWSFLPLSLPPSQTPSWSWPLTIPLTRFGFEDEYYDGSVSWWQHTKPRIWSAFDEPYSSNFARVNQLSDEWYFETNCVGGSLPFFAFPYTGYLIFHFHQCLCEHKRWKSQILPIRLTPVDWQGKALQGRSRGDGGGWRGEGGWACSIIMSLSTFLYSLDIKSQELLYKPGESERLTGR